MTAARSYKLRCSSCIIGHYQSRVDQCFGRDFAKSRYIIYIRQFGK